MEFKFPTNVKQIGDVDEEFKVYIEDYAYTYICQYAKAEAYNEKVAVLLGRYAEAEGKKIVMISGVIQGKFSENIGGSEFFTDESWEYIKSGKERYFKGLEIVGWLHAKAGNGDNLSLEDEQFHEEYFEEKQKILFIVDVVEKMEAIFAWGSEENTLKKLRGYFIYYDKNDNMQEYMLDNKLVKSRSYDYREEEKEEKEDVIVSYKKHDKIRKDEQHQKKMFNMLVCSSAVIVSLCFMMGLLLMQNAQKITNLEQQLAKVNQNYKELSQVSVPVFAAQEDKKQEVTQASTQAATESWQELLTEASSENEKLPQESSTQQTAAAEAESESQASEVIEETQQQAENETQPKESQEITQVNKEVIPSVYVVQPGDTLSEISTYFYGTNKKVKAIMEYNNIKNADKVYAGMTLKLPE